LTDKNNKIHKYWKDKEGKIGERILGRNICEYISGHGDFYKRTWGILYFTENFFCFDGFPEKRFLFSSLFKENRTERDNEIKKFQISWKDVEKIDLPPNKNFLLNIIFPPDYRIFITYFDKSNHSNSRLVLSIYSKKERNRFVEAFHNFKSNSK